MLFYSDLLQILQTILQTYYVGIIAKSFGLVKFFTSKFFQMGASKRKKPVKLRVSVHTDTLFLVFGRKKADENIPIGLLPLFDLLTVIISQDHDLFLLGEYP